MMKKIISFITLFSLLVIQSCRSSADEKMDEYRNDLDLKSELVKKETFKGLSTSEKIDLWKSKLNQILSQDLTNEQKNLVEQIKNEIPNLNSQEYNGVKLIELSIQMAKITPQDEFIRMFSFLGDYKRSSTEYSKVIENDLIVNDLETFLNTVKTRNSAFYENETINKSAKPECNCKWTCGMYGGVDDNCTGSSSGCGFLWLQSCTGHIG